jgi:hypothetical protein
MNYLAIGVAVVVAFVLSTVWYAVFGRQRAELSAAAAAGPGRPPPWKIAVELVRSLAVAVVLAGLADRLGSTDWTGGLWLGLVTWVGFPVVILSGSVLWENVPWKLAAIHAGDWLLKLVAVGILVSVWHR